MLSLRRWGGALIAIMVATAVIVIPATQSAYAKKSKPSPPVSYTYTADGQLATVTSRKKTAYYTYDAAGNLLSISFKKPKTKKAEYAAVLMDDPATAPTATHHHGGSP